MTDPAAHAGRFAEIAGRMQLYFDGLHHSDVARLRAVFHPEAVYACATPGGETVLAMEDYFALVARRPSPAARGETRRDAIAAITFAGPNLAHVRAHCAIAPKYFTDLLTFVRFGGQWRIIAKVFHFDLDA